jgi:hypothetical protein
MLLIPQGITSSTAPFTQHLDEDYLDKTKLSFLLHLRSSIHLFFNTKHIQQ